MWQSNPDRRQIGERHRARAAGDEGDASETGRPLGVRDMFGLSGRSEMEHGRIAFPPGRRDPLAAIRQEVNWDIRARLEDMDRASVDISVLFPTHVSSYCALRDRRSSHQAKNRAQARA
jgi:hypothetical protein